MVMKMERSAILSFLDTSNIYISLYMYIYIDIYIYVYILTGPEF